MNFALASNGKDVKWRKKRFICMCVRGRNVGARRKMSCSGSNKQVVQNRGVYVCCNFSDQI